MPITQISPLDLSEWLGVKASIDAVNRWLERGDGVAVYQDKALDSSTLGHRRFTSYGSDEAQFPGDPPEQLPDFPGEINWRYQLEGVYRGAPIGMPEDHDWASPYVVAERIFSLYHDGQADRISRYGFEVHTVVDPDGKPTQARRFIATIVLLEPSITVEVRAWVIPDRGIDRLDSFDWNVQSGAGVVLNGDMAENLGGAMVDSYNAMLGPNRG